MRLPSLVTFAALPGLFLLTGCSFLYDLSPDQCGNTADCAAFGENYACVEGICKGDSRAECEVAPDCKDFATAPTACIEKVPGNPGSRVCEPLRTTECPMIMPTGGPGQELWRRALATRDPIIVGGFAEVDQDDISTYSAAYDLAFTELQNTRGGVPGPNGSLRSIVAVVCNNGLDAVGMSDAMEHLTEDLRVPGVISAMRSDQLKPLFSNVRNSANNREVLFMSPGEADATLESIQDSDLIWTLLPRAVQLAAVYPPLLDRAIDHLIARSRLVAGDPIKVTLLSADDVPLLAELSNAVEDILEFNGKSFADNLAEGNAQRLDVISSFTDANADLSVRVAEIADFAPNVIVAISADELFSKIIPGIEPTPSFGGEGQVAPFYLLSPYHNQSRSLNLGFLNNYRADPIEVRMAGVQYASAPEEFEPYVAEFQQRFLDLFPDDARSGYENFADAPWWLIYSIAAGVGAKSTFEGRDLVDGMDRLQEGMPFFMGPDDVNGAMTSLINDANSSIQLNGTLGPPSFDNTGIRQSLGSVWCILPSAEQRTDVLRLDEATGELVEDSSGGFTDQCHEGFMPPF